MAYSNHQKSKARKLAIETQQYCYEHLPDWLEYNSSDRDYIKHQIGYALFGCPQIEESKNSTTRKVSTVNNYQGNDLLGRITYDTKSCKVIEKIYQQIIQHGRNINNKYYLGIIYNALVLSQKPQKKAKEAGDELKEEANQMCVVPVFKIKKDLRTVWYIDNEGRIYQNWQDYLENNTLPKCTMFLPKDGVYQCNPHCRVSEYSSQVWVQELNSPACAVKKSVLTALDVAANTLSLGAGIGLGVATFMTPVGPALMTAGLVATGISGTWSIARGSQKLIDYSAHKQSISPMNKNAFSAWLDVSSSVLGLGASGGSVLLSKTAKTVAQGKNISTVAKIAHDSVVVSNLAVRGVGVLFDGYCLIDKYKEEKKIDFADVTVFISHVLFFSNTVINTKLANELIGTWRGTIFEKFKNALRFNRLKEEFKRFTNFNKSSQSNSEGITYRLRNAVSSEDFLKGLSGTNWNPKLHITYEGGKVILNNIKLIDPMVFMGHMLTIGSIGINLIQSGILEDIKDAGDSVFRKLKIVLSRLLQKFFLDKLNTEKSLDVDNFDDMLTEMKHVTNAKDILIKVFKVSTIVLSRCNSPEQFLREMLYFLWTYCKVTLKEHVRNNDCNNSNSTNDALAKIVTCLYDYVDAIGDDLFTAFYTYISNRERPLESNYDYY
nr:PREDICTED: uncharacterized protein LOC100883844 [Megachile rotundata]